jgi:hypothetical protein
VLNRQRVWSGVLAVVLTLPAGAVAQDLSEVDRLPLQGRRLRVGAEVSGRLTAEDAKWVDGTYAQAWGLELRRGEEVTVDLLSDDFDAYLLVGGPGMDGVESNDDGAGACDARLTFRAADGGMFRIVVNTVSVESVGRFRLRVTEDPGPVTEGSCGGGGDVDDLFGESTDYLLGLPTGGRDLRIGQEFPGELRDDDEESPDGSYVQAWALDLRAGDRVVVDLISEEFDPFLWFIGPGMNEPLYDDDGAGACNARIDFTAGTRGTYRVVVNTIGSFAMGRFRLRVTETPGPAMEGDCSGVSGSWIADLSADGRTLTVGTEFSGALTDMDEEGPDGSWVQAWDLGLFGAPSVTVDLLSDAFDAFLFVLTPDGDVLSDDDGAGACDSRVTISSPDDGRYRVVVNTTLPGQVGRYRVRVTEDPGPQTAGGCDP